MTDSNSAAMWLHLLKNRKRMNARTLSRVAGITRDRADSTLSLMASRGSIRAYPDPARRNGRAYAVDAACVLPRGLTLEQVMDALGNAMAVPAAPPAPAEAAETLEREECEAQDEPLPPRGALGHLGRVSSVFALGGDSAGLGA